MDLKKLFISGNIKHAPREHENSNGYNLHRYVKLITEFNKQFYLKDGSIWNSPIFNVPSIIDPETRSHLPTPPSVRNTLLATATIGSLYHFTQRRLLTAYEIGSRYGVYLNLANYFKISGVIRYNIPPQASRPSSRPKPKSIDFFMVKKRTSKALRNILYDANNMAPIGQLKVLLNSYLPGPYPEAKQNEYLNSWYLSFLPPCVKEFALFHTSNKIILNDRRYKFQNTTNECSFCSRFPSTFKIPVETFQHLYFECPFSTRLASNYFVDLFDFDINFKLVSTRGANYAFPTNIVVNIEAILLSYYIYTCRADKRIPSHNSFLHYCFTMKKSMLKNSKKYEKIYTEISNKSGYNIRRLNNKWLLWA